MEGLIEVPKTS